MGPACLPDMSCLNWEASASKWNRFQPKYWLSNQTIASNAPQRKITTFSNSGKIKGNMLKKKKKEEEIQRCLPKHQQDFSS